jgi:hypothetical protein
MQFRERPIRWSAGFVASCFLVLSGCGEEVDREQAARVEATVLPQGVREAWFSAVDQSLNALRFRRGRLLIENGLLGVEYVPAILLGSSCSPYFGISVGVQIDGENVYAPSVTLVGLSSLPNVAAMPSLGVSEMSPAARQLMIELCGHVLDVIDRMARSD